MDRSISASEANQRFSQLLRDVQGGDSFTVTARGRPVARVVPIDDDRAERAAAIDELIDLLRAQPRRNLPGWKREDLYD